MLVINYIDRILSNSAFMQRLFVFCLVLANICYGAYLFLLGFYNRLAADDYCYLNEFRKHGFRSPAAFYNDWQGRFSSQTFINLVFTVYDFAQSLLPYTIFLYALFIYSIYKLIRLFLDHYSSQKLFSTFVLLNISTLIFHVFVAANFAFNTFFWLNVSVMYFGGLGFALLGLVQILSPSRSILTYILLIISFVFVSGSAEHFSAIHIMLLGLALLFYVWKYRFAAFHISIFRKMLLAFLLICVGFIIMFLAPGNDIRRAYFPETSIPKSFIISARSTAILLLHYIPAKVKFLLLLALPALYLGSLSRNFIRLKTYKNKTALAVTGFVALLIFLWICLLPNAYAQGNMGPMRAHTHIAFYLVALSFIAAFLLGFYIAFSKKMLPVLAVFGLLSFAASGLFSLAYDLPEAIRYSQSEELRQQKLQQAKAQNFTGTLVLDSLYHPRKNPMQTEPVLFVNEIARNLNDSNQAWVNRCICGGLQLPYKIKLEE